MVSLVVFVLLMLFAFVGPSFWKYRFDQVLKKPAGANADWIRPSWEHPFGISKGYDVFAQVMRGTQYSIRIALVVTVVSVGLGVVVGAIAGYFRGFTDAVLMRFTDLMLVIPYLAAVAALQRNVKGSTWLWLALFLAFFGWMGIARVIRGEFLSLREKEFVEAARSVGASAPRIIFRHILPNTLGPIIVNATLAVGGAVLAEAALSFLGLGVKPPDTSLGKIIEVGKSTATNIGASLLTQLLGLGQIGQTVTNYGAQLLTLQFSRDNESEADLVGMELADRAGYDPRAGVTLWQKMSAANKGAPPQWLSTHPASTSRINEIRRHLGETLPLYARARGTPVASLPPYTSNWGDPIP